MSSEEIISFLNKYSITQIDPQTSIIAQHQPLPSSTSQSYQDVSSLSFANKNTSKFDTNANKTSAKTPVCYLIKDLIIPENMNANKSNVNISINEQNKILNSILQTLSHHQQLNNKYILTLIHYEMFVKNIPYTHHNTSVYNNLPTQRYQNPNNQYNSNSHNQSFNERSQLGLQNSNIQKQTVYTHASPQSLSKSQSRTYMNMMENSNQSNSQDNDSLVNVNNANKQDQCTRFSRMLGTNDRMNANVEIGMNTNMNMSMGQSNNNYEEKNSNSNLYTHGPHNAIRAIYQYGTLSLKQEIMNRIVSTTQFQQEELWAILATIIQALSYLQQQEIAYGVLGTDRIFINNSLVKVLDPSATACDPLLVTQGRLYSPEILNGQENIDIFKSDVYVIGLIMLECGLLIDLSKEMQPDLNKHKSIFRQAYSKQLLEVVIRCLEIQPKRRPTFQQLKQLVGRQLNWADFSNNYENIGGKTLQPIDSDNQDLNNPMVEEIQFEYEQCNFDILFENLGEDEAIKNSKRRIISQYQRARLKYLGESAFTPEESPRNSSQEADFNAHLYESQRSHSHQNRHNHSASPIEAKRNGKYSSVNHYDHHSNPAVYYKNQNYNQRHPLPHLNMAISESIYPQGCTQRAKANSQQKELQRISRKTSRQQYENYKPCKSRQRQQREQRQKDGYMNFGQQMAKPKQNSSINFEKIKKTKLIKQKLVVRNDLQERNQTFGKNRNVQLHKNIQHPNYNANFVRQNAQRLQNRNKYDQSIEQQPYQESQSSYLYYNTNKGGFMDKENRGIQSNSIKNSGESQNSLNANSMRNSQNLRSSSGMMKNSGNFRKSEHFQNFGMPLTQKHMNENENIYTHPNLMKTIKDNIARIESTKNIQSLHSMQIQNSMKQNRYIK